MLKFNISKSIFIDLLPQGKNYQLLDWQCFNFLTKILTFHLILTFPHIGSLLISQLTIPMELPFEKTGFLQKCQILTIFYILGSQCLAKAILAGFPLTLVRCPVCNSIGMDPCPPQERRISQ